MIEIGRDRCGDAGEARKLEWLETNGLGGFASSTVIGLNTRRYHSLLTAALEPPVARTVLLSKFEEAVVVNGMRHEISANQYPGTIYPQGHTYLKSFRLDPWPVFEYEVAGARVIKSVLMIDGENTTLIDYRVDNLPADTRIEIELRPLVAFRDFHSLVRENGSIDGGFVAAPGLVCIHPYSGLPALYLAHNAASVEPAGYWYRNFEYQAELERGLDCIEDLYNHCVLKFELAGGGSASVIASTVEHNISDAGSLRGMEAHRRESLSAGAGKEDTMRRLFLAASQFIARRGDNSTVIAGYPWFSDWGRDTLISLPGLTLATRRTEVARGILIEFARHIDAGMVPNRFPDRGEPPEYNTVDASLWFFEAARAFLESTGDFDFARSELYHPLLEILSRHESGTRYGIGLDADGLVRSGEPGVQLTWMDAKVGEEVITPRNGKPVEIQALWYNALLTTAELASRFGDRPTAERTRSMAENARAAFNREFWNPEAGCLFDVIDETGKDPSIRPNQILAASLHHSMLEPDRARSVVRAVGKELLTPYGLRTLSPADPRYRGRYEGDQRCRDGAYHQGTVWPWLIGPFISAYFRAFGSNDESRQAVNRMIRPLLDHFNGAGLGQLPELFDGDEPRRPGGCFAQAWSVAELLRVITRFDLG